MSPFAPIRFVQRDRNVFSGLVVDPRRLGINHALPPNFLLTPLICLSMQRICKYPLIEHLDGWNRGGETPQLGERSFQTTFHPIQKRYNRLLGGTILSDHLNDSVKRWRFELDIR